MKIIQMQIGQTSPEDFQVFGLGDDGMLYEWVFKRLPYAIRTEKGRAFGGRLTCPEGSEALNACIQHALDEPEKYHLEWVPGSTAGWRPCAQEKSTPRDMEHSMKPKD